MHLPSPASRLRGAVAAAIVLVGFGLAACAPETPETSPSGPPSPSASAGSGASSTPEDPSFQPDGSAEDNLPIFSAITQQVWASEDRGSGRAYIDALVGAGFDRSGMQLTQDLTTVGNAVESLQFSVRWGEERCLIGQVGPSTGEPVTVVVDQLAEGRCLVGNTRSIDW